MNPYEKLITAIANIAKVEDNESLDNLVHNIDARVLVEYINYHNNVLPELTDELLIDDFDEFCSK